MDDQVESGDEVEDDDEEVHLTKGDIKEMQRIHEDLEQENDKLKQQNEALKEQIDQLNRDKPTKEAPPLSDSADGNRASSYAKQFEAKE